MPTINEAFRDYVTNGVPDSGANPVKKSEVRQAWDQEKAALVALMLPNVKSYGAAGNGATNDTNAINTGLGTTGAQLYFPPGDYLINASVLAANLRFTGPGRLKIGTDFLPIGDIRENITVNVGAGRAFVNITAALVWAHDRRILPNATLTIQIADGAYDVIGSNYFGHPDGARIRIIGNQATPANVVFTVKRNNSGVNTSFLEFEKDANLGFIDGMVIQGDGWQSSGQWYDDATGKGRQTFGVVAFKGCGEVNIGSNIIIRRLYVGVRCQEGGTIHIGAGARIEDGGDACLLARGSGSNIIAQRVIIRGAGDQAFSLGHNAIAEDGAHIDLIGARSLYAPSYGGHVSVQGGGNAKCMEMLIGFDGNNPAGEGIGFRCIGGGGVIHAYGSVVRDCLVTAQATRGGVILVDGLLSFDHRLGGGHFEAKGGGHIGFGYYQVFDNVGLQGAAAASLPTRTMKRAGAPAENINDLFVQAGAYTNEAANPAALARQTTAISIYGVSYTPDGAQRAKAINVAAGGFNNN